MKYQLLIAAVAVALFNYGDEAKANPGACGAAKISEVRAASSGSLDSVIVDCNLVLTSSDYITKQIIIEGSASNGLIMNCNGATIVNNFDDEYIISVQSRVTWVNGERNYDPVENVTVKNCDVFGRIGVQGNRAYLDIDKTANAVQTLRAQAPDNITFDNIEVTTTSRVGIYVRRGVKRFKLKNSYLGGTSSAPALYLGAESTGAVITDNYFWMRGNQSDREQLAVDASDYNQIKRNTFKGLHRGGIYLYRNCGEGGEIRHTTPSHNEIEDNDFYYENYSGSNKAVDVGSRGGTQGYCNQDDGYPYGSSASDLDHATFNTVAYNRVYNRNPSSYIVVRSPSTNHSNSVFNNVRVNGNLPGEGGGGSGGNGCDPDQGPICG